MFIEWLNKNSRYTIPLTHYTLTDTKKRGEKQKNSIKLVRKENKKTSRCLTQKGKKP